MRIDWVVSVSYPDAGTVTLAQIRPGLNRRKQTMLKPLRRTLTHALRLSFYGAFGVLLTLVVVFVLYLDGRTDLDVWHRADLDEEFPTNFFF